MTTLPALSRQEKSSAKPSASISGLLISDFNIQTLANYLNHSEQEPSLDISVAPFGQISQALRSEATDWKELTFILVWSRLESISLEFANCLQGKPIDAREFESEIQEFAALLSEAATKVEALFVPTWVIPPLHPGWGITDLKANGAARLLLRANALLLELLDPIKNIFPLPTDAWMAAAERKVFNPRLWYSGKIPFSNEFTQLAAARIRSALSTLKGKTRKLIILDLDNTIWGGIVGEVGIDGLVLGGHDPIGEAYVDFQKELKALTARGVILGLVSKNEEEVAIGAVKQHPEMILSLNDIAGWQINWDDKAENISRLLRTLNLSADAAVFIDDNELERDRVRQALPDVLVPDWPEDARLYPQALLKLDCFDKLALTGEDRQRAAMYSQERKRSSARATAQSFEQWLESLKTVVELQPLDATNRGRIVQLLNKTNQMNLATRRMSEGELVNWLNSNKGGVVWGLRMNDKFGDSGLVGILSLQQESNQVGRIIDFVLSCRVMARQIEQAMMLFAVTWARENGLQELEAVYEFTPRNKPCLDFLRRSGFKELSEKRFSWDCSQPYPASPFITLNSVPGRRTAGSCETGGDKRRFEFSNN